MIVNTIVTEKINMFDYKHIEEKLYWKFFSKQK